MIDKPDKTQLRYFWEQRQKNAGTNSFSGYLSDESPAIIGQTRFKNEKKDLHRWLDSLLYGHAACLDLGCGTGEWTMEFSKRFEKVDAMDWAKSMLHSTQFKVKEAGIKNCRFFQGEISSLKGKQRYDFIFIGGVLMYATDTMLPIIFQRAQALLKPGGLLVLRESTHPGSTLYRRNFKLRSGLLATEKSKHNYAAIYRDASIYKKAIKDTGLKLLFSKTNRHYKFTDLVEAHLRWLDRHGLALEKNPQRAEKWAKIIFFSRFLSLWPTYLCARNPLKNIWFAARKPS